MKRGLEIGIEVIKPQAKEGNTSIQELHHRANDITYKYNRRYIPPQTALRLFEKLREIGIELKDVSVNERTKAKKDELLSIIRKQCLSLKSYYDSYVWSKDDAKQVDSTLRFQLAMYLKNKDTSDILSLLVISNFVPQKSEK